MDYLKIRQKMIFILQIAAVGLIAAIIILVCLPAAFYRTKESKVVAETQTRPVAVPKVTEAPKPEKVEKYVALTFDDGPTPTVTNRILDTLEKHGARATFFVVGRQVKHDKDLIKRAANLGCEIGNHTWEHRQMTKFTKKSLKKSLDRTEKAVAKYVGFQINFVRPTYGAVNAKVKKEVGRPLIYWNVDTEDWESRNAKKILKKVQNVSDGDIILMHDTYSTTADAVEKIVPYLQKKGYQLVTVGELMAKKGVKLKAGKIYYSAG